MTELPPIHRIPRAILLPRGRQRFIRPLVWLVPAVAVAIVAVLAVRALRQRGPEVTITFATAEGLEAHRTTIKYKSVDIGTIRTIELLEDRSGVLVTADLTRKAEGLLVEDARFWVVRPRVSTAGVSGIGTLLTGAHIAFDAGVSKEPRRDFMGLEAPPSTISDRRGRRFVLRADNLGSLDVGSPLYLRRLQVGQVTRLGLDEDGRGVTLEVFVDAPHDRHVTESSRFWNASGVDLTVSARGIKLDTQSLTSVLLGGIAFEAPPEAPAEPASVGAEFKLFVGREAAMRQGGRTERYQLVFSQSVRGLTAGAPVELLGVEAGEVAEISAELDARTGRPRSVVAIDVHPDRVRGLDPAQGARPLLARLTRRGLRAQLRSENLLTGQRYVALDFAPGTRRGRVDWRREPVELPTLEGPADDLPSAAGRLLARWERLPLAELAREGTLAAREMRRTMASDSPLQQDMRAALRDLSGAGFAMRSLAEYLERYPEALLRGKKADR